MYSASDLFSKAYAYCTEKYDKVAVLSAEYGLLFPDDIIEPYDKTLNNVSLKEREEWAEKVFEQMKSRLNLNEIGKAYFHCGKKYRENLIPKLEEIGIAYEVPLENLGIGKQKAWYKERLAHV
jgi:hypothetical protein